MGVTRSLPYTAAAQQTLPFEAVGGVDIPWSKIHTGANDVDGGPVAVGNPFDIAISDGTNRLGTSAHPLVAGLSSGADLTVSGQPWTSTIGKRLTLTAAGTVLVTGATGMRLRSLSILNPHGTATFFYFLYLVASAPTWSGAALVVADDTLIVVGQGGANNSTTPTSDLPGGLDVPAGKNVILVVSTVSGAAVNTNYGAPTTSFFATYRSGT